jgi:hypothetical protein
MNNQLAEETIANSYVANELRKVNENQSRELAHLIDQMTTIMEIFTGREPFRKDNSEERFNVLKNILDDFSEWEKEIQNSDLDAKEKKSSFLPKATWLAWKLILTNAPRICRWIYQQFPKNYVLPQKFRNLQNTLENHFSQVYY